MRTSVLLAAACAWACADVPPTAPGPAGAIVATVTLRPGLVQTVRVEPAVIHTGDTLRISAVLRNTGPLPTATLEVSICGLGLRGTLATESPFVHCAGYSMATSLAPGDSVTDGVARIVRSAPGTYTLDVQQLRTDTGWVPLTVTVH